MPKIRVLVADDSLTIRKYLVEVLRADPDLEVVGEASTGKEAIALCQSLRPDVITMDMMMPVMTGLAATEYIMAHFPTPILVVSASINRGELFKTYDALTAGALDVLDKPTGDETNAEWERKLVSTVKLLSRIRVITHPRARLERSSAPSAPASPRVKTAPDATGTDSFEVVAIGASTGGPGAIVDVLRGIPTSFEIPILFVLHISEPFALAFAEWLDAQTPRAVRYAKSGDLIESARGQVLMAPPDYHLGVSNGRAFLNRAPERHSCRPSVDVLFESVAQEYGKAAAGCLLTGMGRDGAAGLAEIRKAGGFTIAQDESTCVVYGMPREAVLLDAAMRVLTLPKIGPAIAALANRVPRSPA
ncbi:MAG: chemotaxis-specific protein-glutamate methyltransferase CheB [Polyangiales bacterium]|nr:chemotaxis-specific protein-glutamate methyltransferase CheB [Myxococcales bacterium]